MASENVLQVTDQNIDAVLGGSLPVLLDFTATWCVPCKAIAPFVDQLADEMKGRLAVGKVDVDMAQATAARFGIRSVPTLLLVKGGQVVGQNVGKITKDKLKEFASKAL